MAMRMGGTHDWDDLSLNQSRKWNKVEVEREVNLAIVSMIHSNTSS